MSPPICVAIIGAGLSGISQAIHLREALGDGVDIEVYDKSASEGGTWRDSLWPDASSDVPSHRYQLPGNFKPDWKFHYATQPEILEYWTGLIDKHEIRDCFVFGMEFVSSTWSSGSNSHSIKLKSADGVHQTIVCDVLIAATGPLSAPTFPSIPGLKNFAGIFFHNLQWRKDVDFTGKRVALMGNGSSAIQMLVCPHIHIQTTSTLANFSPAGLARMPGVKITQFIRSGGYFIPKENFAYPWWAKAVFRWVPGAQRFYRWWLIRKAGLQWKPANVIRIRQQLLDHLVAKAPPKYLEALTPTYPMGCKRVAYDDGWLESLHLPNVELVSNPITLISESGMCTRDGREFDADIIIFATGSNVAEHGIGLSVGVYGLDPNVDLRDYWAARGGPQAYRGVSVPNFPNYFIILGPNATTSSWGETSGIQSAYIARIIKGMVEKNLSSIEPKETSTAVHNAAVQSALTFWPISSMDCTNWWRVGGQGLSTVANPVSLDELDRQNQTIDWSDWVAVGRKEAT